MIEAAQTQFKDTITFNKSVNDGSMLGVGLLPGSVGGGIRNSSANYLAGGPRANLHVLTEAIVTKVLFTEGEAPKATGVEYAAGPNRMRPSGPLLNFRGDRYRLIFPPAFFQNLPFKSKPRKKSSCREEASTRLASCFTPASVLLLNSRSLASH